MSLADKSSNPDQRAQPAGMPHGVSSPRPGASGPDADVFALHATLVELEPDAATRAALVGVSEAVDAAWVEGRMAPVLRAKAKSVRAAIASIEFNRQP